MLLALAPPPHNVPVLLELFTSEGCSSCPPADRLLERIDAVQPFPGAHVIVLSEHVDYWNALGWRDPYSSAQFTDRQNAYVERIDPGSGPYTPELVVDGRFGTVGSDDDAIAGAVARAARAQKSALRVSASASGNTIEARIDAAPAADAATLYVAIADERDQSVVTRGENAGRTLTHVAVVRTLESLGAVPARSTVRRTAVIHRPDERHGARIVAFLQDRASGAIVAIGETTLR